MRRRAEDGAVGRAEQGGGGGGSERGGDNIISGIVTMGVYGWACERCGAVIWQGNEGVACGGDGEV